jgi:hypothetical protein
MREMGGVTSSFPAATNPSRWQRSTPYNNPFLFVIPSAARDLQFRGPFLEMFYELRPCKAS